MKASIKNASFALLLAAGAIFAAGPVLADKPSWAGKGKGNDDKGDKGGQHEGKRKHFKDHDREYVRDYYAGEYSRKGKCPPGLAKKNNGCMPPGQAKKLYRTGQRWPGNYGYSWNYNQIPYDLRNRYGFDPDDRYYYGDGYLYQVDPTTMLISQVVSAILR